MSIKQFFATDQSGAGTVRSSAIPMDTNGNIKERTISPYATDFGGVSIALYAQPKGNTDASKEKLISTITSPYDLEIVDGVSLDYELFVEFSGQTGSMDACNVEFS